MTSQEKYLITEQAEFVFDVLKKGSNLVELRGLHKKGVQCGFFNNREAFLKTVASYSGVINLYFLMNERDDKIDQYKWNQLQPAKKTCGDENILKRRYFLIDLDTRRRVKEKVSATNDEIEDATESFQNIVNVLNAKNVEFYNGFSGNGRHILIPTIDYQCDSTTNQEFQILTNYFADKFSTEFAEVDSGVYNPARICRLYGSLTMKGENTVERPWRMAKIENLMPIESKYKILDLFRDEIESQKIKFEYVDEASTKPSKHFDIVSLFKEPIQ